MRGLQHTFIAGLSANTSIQYAIPTSKEMRHEDLYLTQSMLDSSCGLICVLQAAMLLYQLPRARVEALTTTKHQALRRLWLVARETYFEGTTEPEIEAYVKAFSPTLTCTTVTSHSAKRIGLLVAKAVRTGQAPMVRFESTQWCHWAFITGIETFGSESVPRAFLMLDPSAAQPRGSFYNARLELQAKAGLSKRARTPHNLALTYSTGEAWAVRLNGLVVINRGQSP